MNKITETISKNIKNPAKGIGAFSSFLMFQFRIWPLCFKQLKTNRSDLQAAALAYNTIFGFIPLLIVVLVLFQSLPGYEDIGNTIRDSIFEAVQIDEFSYSDPDQPGEKVKLGERFSEIVSGFFKKSHRGAATIFSLLIVFWAAIKLLSTVEGAFNYIWGVNRNRPFIYRVFYYWTILTLGPLLIGAGIYFKTMGLITEHLDGIVSLVTVLGGWNWLLTILSFYLLFWSMPNTKVKPHAAFWGALVTTLIWTFVKKIYGYYVFEFEPFKQIYGVLALIPITILWINISWLVVLFGVHLTFIVQNFRELDAAEKISEEAGKFYYPSEDCAVQIASFVGEKFDQGGGPVTEDQIYKEFGVPYHFITDLLSEFVKKGILYEVGEQAVGYIPSKSTDKMSLSETASVVNDMPRQYSSSEYDSAKNQLNNARENLTLADMIKGKK
ncbi:YhjD/YihY/BrkB family envelope integrity protein [Sedimentisphaera salicampi]|uniref:YihY family inner membrane protein n=1 Tax=Sedimentisphaera salicampi TaxID=1941349 RepID=A0A1W6LQB0_9BACT|nr:YhjD/YihY/BrkB family envelope integrity protein [Sedimentisphaera salicampi]ARN57985.1 ribonuclease BN/unknown domain fusion protein [Sedimentisphaera salicampi]